MDRTLPVGALVVVAIAYAASVAIKNNASDSASSARSAERPALSLHTPGIVPPSTPEGQQTIATEVPIEAALLAQVEHKYRFLIDEVDRRLVDELQRRLLERESEADLGARDRMDANLGELLPADSFAYYQRLKDSDLEQHHLGEFTGGISNVAPLEERQERILLDAKLRQKQRYAAAMREIGMERDALSVEEREYAHRRTTEALEQYMEDFLTDVAPSLTPEQYTQLKNYETTEFSRELGRMQQRINAK